MGHMIADWLARNWLASAALLISAASMCVATLNTLLNWREKRRSLNARLRWTHIMDTRGRRLSDDSLAVSVKNKGCSLELVDLQFDARGEAIPGVPPAAC